jgi:predicted nuclease of restriction endonuclease-like (RecB) superfamily
MQIEKQNIDYSQLVSQISETFEHGQQQAILAVNSQLVETYWKIGQYIVEFEQGGSGRAKYGKKLLEHLSKDLSILHKKGFSVSNIQRMRQFYIVFPICAELPHQLEIQNGAELTHLLQKAIQISAEAPHQLQISNNNSIVEFPQKWQRLSWTHWVELLKIDDPLERSFYMHQTINENWSTTQLIRQKKSSLYLRLAASKDKDGILALAREGQKIANPFDIIREPYMLDFLQIPESHQISETELESRIINQLQQFLLEVGKGFAFVGRQYRIMLGNRPHRVDLVFYHYILKCFVLIDLKKEDANYQDVGQMNMYLGYFENEENNEGDNPPIGIVLARQKDEYEVKYAMHNISSRLFVSKYQLYLPDKETLKAIIEQQINSANE